MGNLAITLLIFCSSHIIIGYTNGQGMYRFVIFLGLFYNITISLFSKSLDRVHYYVW